MVGGSCHRDPPYICEEILKRDLHAGLLGTANMINLMKVADSLYVLLDHQRGVHKRYTITLRMAGEYALDTDESSG